MKISITILFVLLCSFLFAGNSHRIQPTSEQTRPTQCCFVREGYQGTCRVTPDENETCESILEYLNSAGTIGKTYCGGSKLRGGWKLAECPAEENSTTTGK
jgi:hypothetical protein